MGIVLPLYIDPLEGASTPSDLSDAWECVLQERARCPDVPLSLIINPDSGPGEGRRDSYRRGIDALQRTGITVMGYLPCGYMREPGARLQEMKQQWYSWYPSIDGLFIDEFPSYIDQALAARCGMFVADGKIDPMVNPGTSLKLDRAVRQLPFSTVISWENTSYPDTLTTLGQIEQFSQLKVLPELGALVLGQRYRSHLMRKHVDLFYDWSFVTPSPEAGNTWGVLDCRSFGRQMRTQQRRYAQ
ncbi:MAG: spherulation-specific family 4 protein [Spirochaetia bacterium]|nr:spherulation-specific family 4 protein [Spirochaetia bacterium]